MGEGFFYRNPEYVTIVIETDDQSQKTALT
jgi:hypothetical protein